MSRNNSSARERGAGNDEGDATCGGHQLEGTTVPIGNLQQENNSWTGADRPNGSHHSTGRRKSVRGLYAKGLQKIGKQELVARSQDIATGKGRSKDCVGTRLAELSTGRTGISRRYLPYPRLKRHRISGTRSTRLPSDNLSKEFPVAASRLGYRIICILTSHFPLFRDFTAVFAGPQCPTRFCEWRYSLFACELPQKSSQPRQAILSATARRRCRTSA